MNDVKNLNSDSLLFKKKPQIESQVSKLLLARKQLPVYLVQNQIINAIQNHDTIILIGETGSGKTTQIPQFIFKSILVKTDKSSLCITQPRRVAAISLATRVAQEMNTNLGGLVGYSVRFEDRSCDRTKIKFMTDGMLLRETLTNSNLTKYKLIILDEAHERSVQTDILFTLVKEIQKRRLNSDNPLKIIIMSATMNVDKFSNFFNKAPVYYLEGRLHPIKIYNSIKEQSDYQHAALVTVFQIHQNEPEGDILVFCTGQEEIESMVRTTNQTASDLPKGSKKILPLPLYSALPTDLQLRVFNPAPEKGTRKVIYSTNIAETSITIPGIKYVVDSGKVKCKVFKSSIGIEILRIENISKAQAKQRSGRAGRESSGICYRLYTKEEQDKFADYAKPEIIRTSLESILLQLSALNIKNFNKFDFIDMPSPENIKKSTLILRRLNAIKKLNDNEYELTKLGKQMTTFPLDPKFSRILIESSKAGCTEEILTILSLLYVDTVFHVPVEKREHAMKVIDKFTSSEGDHITLLNVYKAFRGVNGNKGWCRENFINQRNLRVALDVRKQLSALCDQANLTKTSCNNDTEKIRKCLLQGLFMNVAKRKKEGHYEVEQTNEKVYIHPSSCLSILKPDYVVYTEIIQTTKCYIRQLSIIEHRWLDMMNIKTNNNANELNINRNDIEIKNSNENTKDDKNQVDREKLLKNNQHTNELSVDESRQEELNNNEVEKVNDDDDESIFE